MKNAIMALLACLALGTAACSEDPAGCPADTPATCGNGVIEAGEMCDQGGPNIPPDFGTNSCAAMIPGTEGQLRCQCCQVDNSMCAPAGPTVGGNGG